MIDIYTLTAIVFFLCSFISFSKGPKTISVQRMLLCFIIWLIFYESFRWEIGTDWFSYYNGFMTGYGGENSHVEFGYALLVNAIRKITNSYTLFLLLITSFIYIVVYRIIKKYSVHPIISLCIYFCTMLGLLGSNRQIIALMICILSWDYIFERKFWLFLAFIALAFSVHSTALIFLPAYFIVNSNVSQKEYIVGLFIALLIGLSGFVDKIPYADYLAYLDASSSNKLNYYSSGEATAYSIMGSLKRCLLAFLCLEMNRTYKDFIISAFTKLYIVGVIIYLIFNGSILSLMAGRGALYYNICEIMIIPFAISTIAARYRISKLFWVIYFVVIFYIMLRDINSYYLLGGVDIYRPYKSVLF